MMASGAGEDFDPTGAFLEKCFQIDRGGSSFFRFPYKGFLSQSVPYKIGLEIAITLDV